VGEVWRAEDLVLARPVAVKLRPTFVIFGIIASSSASRDQAKAPPELTTRPERLSAAWAA
jgi:hypothetical protein